MSKDITNLSGNDLFDFLASGQSFTVKAPTKQQKQQALLTTKVMPFVDPWQDLSTVLLVHVQRCKCGCTYESPNAIRFVKRQHKRLGTLHWRRLDELAAFEEHYNSKLPAEIAYREETITACQRCFGLTRLLTGQGIQHTKDIPVLDEPTQPEYISSTSIDRSPVETVISIASKKPDIETEDDDGVEEVAL